MRYLLLLFLSVLVSCSQNSQLRKDLNVLLDDSDIKYSTKDSASKRTQVQENTFNQESEFKKKGKSREDLVNLARQYLGTPYVYGAADPSVGFDCSGFINFVYSRFGHSVPRSSKDFLNFGSEIPLHKVQKGDLLIFNGTDLNVPEVGHIGIVLKSAGKNSEFIHSSSGKANGVTVSSLSSPHYTARFIKAISVID
ncbi:MAG: C40 family peptidase [Kaistella sp.]|nr:C40 family peptidase [Kaistella sp.]